MKKQIYNNKIILLIILFIIMIINSIAFYIYYISPKYSLNIIKKAIEQHDTTTFLKYVDLDNVSNSIFDQIIKFKEEEESKNKNDEFASNIALGFSKIMKSQFSNEIKQNIIKYIENSNQDNKLILNNIWDKIGKDKSIKMDSTKTDGKISLINFIINQPKYNKDLDFHILMRDKGLYWQIADLPDIYNNLTYINDLEKERITNINKPIINEFKNSISFYDFEKENSSDEWGINRYINYKFKIKNISNKDIKSFYLTLTINDKEKSFERVIKIKHEEIIKSNDILLWRGYEESNKFIKNFSNFYSANQDDIEINLSLDVLIFTDGKELKIIE